MSYIFLAILAILLAFPRQVHAQYIGGQSALLTPSSVAKKSSYSKKDNTYLMKKKVIQRVLEKYHSPMADSADAFVETCMKYNLDCYLLPSIAGVESFFGTQLIPGSYNPFGWGRGLIMFKDWSAGIDTVGKGLREDYINQGLLTTDAIGRKYCEGNTWSGKVNNIKSWFVDEEKNVQLYFANDTVEL